MLLTIQDAARALNVSPHTVRMEVYRKRLAVVRVGRRTMIDPQDLEAYKRARRTPARWEK